VYWQENKPSEDYVIPDSVVDAVFGISCRNLPVDHAYALSQAIQTALPWFTAEADAGLHTIHGADSGNGWMRPEDPRALLQLSHRTKFLLRLPKQRLADAEALLGKTLDVAGHALRLDKLTVRPLSRITTLFTRHLVIAAGHDESAFLQHAMELFAALGIRPAKMLCGKMTTIALPAQSLQTRSLMVADLTVEEAVLLQQRGLGPERKLGCGLFIPHKDINEVRRKSE
jgi:CRISPR-associated protein Cas6